MDGVCALPSNAGSMSSRPSARPLVGLFILLGSALGAYMAENGHIMDLLQPGALLLVGGVAFGVGVGGEHDLSQRLLA